MIASNGIEIKVGQFWVCGDVNSIIPHDLVEIVVIRGKNVGGYIARGERLVVMDQDDFIRLATKEEIKNGLCDCSKKS